MNTTPCPVVSDTNAFLQKQDQAQAEYNAIIDLTETDPAFDAFDPENVLDAIYAMTNRKDMPSYAKWAEACASLRDGDFNRFACVVSNFSIGCQMAAAASELKNREEVREALQ